MYDPTLVEKPALLFINKTDIIHNAYNTKLQQKENNNNNNDINSSSRISPPIVVSNELQRLADKLRLKIFYGRWGKNKWIYERLSETDSVSE